MKWYVILTLFVFMVGYLFAGGAIFRELESSKEQDTKTVSRERIQKFLDESSCVDRTRLEQLITEVVQAYDQGVLVTNQTETNDNWDFLGAISFSVTVITTIGYGHVSPSTWEGRLFFIFYAILGIPLCAFFLAGIGEKLHVPVRKLKNCADNTCVRILITTLVYLLVLAMLILLPAIGFHRSQEWTYFESIYYCVVTLTTIGFGDFVPGQEGAEDVTLRRVLMMVWIFVGLAWVSSMFSAVQDFMADKTTRETQHDSHNGDAKHSGDKAKEVQFTQL